MAMFEGDLMGNTRIKKELTRILDTIPQEKRCIGESLIAELLFMGETLRELKREIKQRGTLEEFTQGKQAFMREAPALTSYTKLIARYGAIFKQLCDMMPRAAQEAPSALMDWLQDDGSADE